MCRLRLVLWSLLAVGSVVSGGGCAWLPHNLQPHRLHRLNRTSGPSYDPEFSAIEIDSGTGELVMAPVESDAKVVLTRATDL